MVSFLQGTIVALAILCFASSCKKKQVTVQAEETQPRETASPAIPAVPEKEVPTVKPVKIVEFEPSEENPVNTVEAEQQKLIVKQIDKDNFKIGEVKLNKKTKEITFPAEIGNPQDIIEYLLVSQHGKIHESLLTTKIRPLHLNIAFKLLSYTESKELFRILGDDFMMTDKYHQETADTKKAARFNIFISWKKDGTEHSYHINELIFNDTTQKHAEIQPYIYGGSYLRQGKFQADLTGDIVAIFTDRGAVANFSNKGNDDDTIWFANTERLPDADTKLTITLKQHQPQAN